MLKNRYDEILIGLNMTSLLRGLIATKNNKSVLLIDDKRFRSPSLVTDFVCELEIQSFFRIASRFEIKELGNIRKFIRPAIVDLNTDQVRLRVGGAPFDNLRELIRKYPELIDRQDLDLIYYEGENQFNEYFIDELKKFEAFSFDNFSRGKGGKYEFSSSTPKWFRGIFNKFFELINAEYAEGGKLKFNSLLHMMSLVFEEKMKSRIHSEEVTYYFFKLLSPQYRLQDFILLAQLKRRLMINGGDYKESKIQYWQFYQGRFENLLLTSFEGVISADKVLFFTHLPQDLPFTLRSDYPFYRSVQMHVDKSSISTHPAHHVVIQSKSSAIGSDKPFTVMSFDQTLSFYQMPYLSMPGSKASFYETELNKTYQSDAKNLPFLLPLASFSDCLNATLDLRALHNHKNGVKMEMGLELEYEGLAVSAFEYWGNHKYFSLGYLGLTYGISQN